LKSKGKGRRIGTTGKEGLKNMQAVLTSSKLDTPHERLKRKLDTLKRRVISAAPASFGKGGGGGHKKQK